ncbi:MAG: tRNA (guanosine(37)-N1)-methyltransferase TrmD [Candidatus Kapabacteria bacterium]|nr:tRNA (guanosine(37)-N1)-methyltransferase TrmD [Candidatus Kapabacteria bacterium]
MQETEIKNVAEPALRIDIVTGFSDMFDSVFGASIIKIAQEKGLVKIVCHNLHDYADDKYRHIDDTVFGGGAGMLIKCAPVFKCIEALQAERHYDEIIYVTADGERITQTAVNRLSMLGNIIIICGHFKGIDQRIRDHFVTLELSLGDFVLSGGELPAMVLVDSIVRLIPGVLGDIESGLEDSFMNGVLEAPNYTKPADFRGMKVPDVLLSGNHAEIRKWREQQEELKTAQRRPDLFEE